MNPELIPLFFVSSTYILHWNYLHRNCETRWSELALLLLLIAFCGVGHWTLEYSTWKFVNKFESDMENASENYRRRGNRLGAVKIEVNADYIWRSDCMRFFHRTHSLILPMIYKQIKLITSRLPVPIWFAGPRDKLDVSLHTQTTQTILYKCSRSYAQTLTSFFFLLLCVICWNSVDTNVNFVRESSEAKRCK